MAGSSTSQLRRSGALVVVALVLSLVGAPPLAAVASGPRGLSFPSLSERAAALAAPRLTASPSSAIVREKVRLRGKLPPPARRPAVLQRKKGSTWVKVRSVRTTAKGKFSFVTKARPRTTTYRVTAPATNAAPSVKTPKRAVTTVPQTVTFTMAASVAPGAEAKVSASFTPVRPGRAVQLQRQSGGSWLVVDSGTEGSAGTAILRADTDTIGNGTYRVVALPYAGAAAAVSATRTLTVTGPTPPPPPPPPPPPADTTPPGKVSGLQVADKTSDSLTLTWVNPLDTDLAGVRVRRLQGSTPPQGPGSGVLVYDGFDGEVVDAALAPGTTYSYALFAYDEVPNSSAAATITDTTLSHDNTAPGPVTDLVATSTQSTVTLSWVNPLAGDLTGVMVRRAAGATPPVSPMVGTLVSDAAGTSVTDTGLSPGTQYSYTVFAHDAVPNYAAGAGATIATKVLDSSPPGPVTALSVSATARTVTLNWTNPAAADLEGVLIRRAPGATPPATATAGTAVADVAAPGSSHLDSGLSPSTQYSYALFAHDSTPNHSAAATATITTSATPVNEWPQSRQGPGHASWAPDEQVLTPANVGGVAEEWSLQAAGSPAIVGGLLYATRVTSLSQTVVAAYDLSTAQPVWEVTTQGSCYGPLAVTASLVVVNCDGAPRAYDRGGSHALVWDVAVTDPGQSLQSHLVSGTSLVAWSSNRVANYRLSDGQRLWQQLLPSGAQSVYDVVASDASVVVAYDDRLRALNLNTGTQLWSRPDITTGQLVVSANWVYATDDGMVKQVALTGGADGWSVTVPDTYRMESADGDTLYVWAAVFDFGPPSPSTLHALRLSDGAQRWQASVPSRVGAVSIVGDLVWFTSTEIFSQGKYSNLIGLRRSDGQEVKRFDWNDNIYGGPGIAFGAGKVVLEQGGSAGFPPPRLRVLGLGGQVPVIADQMLPLAYVGAAYSHQLTASGPGPRTWSLASGSLPTGLALSATGLISGTPTAAATSSFRVQVTSPNGRYTRRDLSLAVVQPGASTGWGLVGKSAARNPVELAETSLDVGPAPAIAFRWKTATADALTAYGTPTTVGNRLYLVDSDGLLKAWDTTGSTTNRAPLWSVAADSSVNGNNYYVGVPVVDGNRLVVHDIYGYLTALSTTNGSVVWRSSEPVGSIDRPPLLVAGSLLVITGNNGVKAYASATGTPLWGDAETTAPHPFVTQSLSSDGTLAFAATGCELYAINVSDGAVAWHTPIRTPLPPDCQSVVQRPAAPVVADGKVFLASEKGLLSVTASTGAPVLRVATWGYGPHAVLAGTWIYGDWGQAALTALDTTTGEVRWQSREAPTISDLAISRDLILVNGPGGPLQGFDRTTGALVWDGGYDPSTATGQGLAIGAGRIFVGRSNGVHAFGPL
jgi:outer membrane protein assembly factor BamB